MQNKRVREDRISEKAGIIQNHINKNLKNYIIIFVIFLCGVVLGVLFINNVSETQAEEISGYISSFLNRTKENASIDYMKLLFDSIRQNLSLALLLWFVGLTVVGVIAVYGIIAYRGFCLRI